jgi:hypothetical protein
LGTRQVLQVQPLPLVDLMVRFVLLKVLFGFSEVQATHFSADIVLGTKQTLQVQVSDCFVESNELVNNAPVTGWTVGKILLTLA